MPNSFAFHVIPRMCMSNGVALGVVLDFVEEFVGKFYQRPVQIGIFCIVWEPVCVVNAILIQSIVQLEAFDIHVINQLAVLVSTKAAGYHTFTRLYRFISYLLFEYIVNLAQVAGRTQPPGPVVRPLRACVQHRQRRYAWTLKLLHSNIPHIFQPSF